MTAQAQTSRDTDRIVRMAELKSITALSRSGIYALIKRGSFPASVPLGKRAVGWFLSDVQAWLQSRKAASTKEAA